MISISIKSPAVASFHKKRSSITASVIPIYGPMDRALYHRRAPYNLFRFWWWADDGYVRCFALWTFSRLFEYYVCIFSSWLWVHLTTLRTQQEMLIIAFIVSLIKTWNLIIQKKLTQFLQFKWLNYTALTLSFHSLRW